MPDLMAALRNADAAGDVDAARRIAAMIKAQGAAANPTEGMSTTDRTLAGIGSGMTDVVTGSTQLQAHAAHSPWGAGALAAINPALLLAGMAMSPDAADAAAKDKAQTDKALRDTTAGTVGNAIGKIAATLPAALAGGAPSSILGAMGAGGGQGAAMAAFDPVADGNFAGEKAKQVAVGGLFGALTGGALKVGGSALSVTVGNVKKLANSVLKDMLPNVTQAARERAAAQILREAAADASKIGKPGQQFVPGTAQTTAEAADDVGLSGLQRTLQSMSPEFNTQVTQMAQANNAARVDALRGAFGGAEESAAQQIEQARNAATLPLLTAAKKLDGVDTRPVIGLSESIIRSREGRPAVQGVIAEVRDLLKSGDRNDVAYLYNVRQHIGDLLSGRAGANNEAAKAATRELMTIKTALDAQIGKAAPQFRQYLKDYAQMSREAGQVRMGSELLGKSSATLDANGNPVLSAAQFGRAANDLDRVAQAATGFRKQTAERLMTPEQQGVVGAVRADLDRMARTSSQGKSIGSDTVQKAVGASKVQDAAGLTGQVGWLVAKAMNPLRAHYGEKTLALVQQAMLNPSEAASLLAKVPANQQSAIANLLADPRFAKAMRAAQEAARVGATGAAAYQGGEAADAWSRRP